MRAGMSTHTMPSWVQAYAQRDNIGDKVELAFAFPRFLMAIWPTAYTAPPGFHVVRLVPLRFLHPYI